MTRHHCALCRKPGKAETMTYSHFTGNRYCLDYRACERRVKRAKRHLAAGLPPSDGASA